MTAKDFLETGPTEWDELIKDVRLTVKPGAELPFKERNQWQKGSNGYRCTLTFQGRSYSFDFWEGKGCNGDANLDVILHCLSMDARVQDSFEEFCDDFGYNEDSRMAERIYKSCLETRRQLKILFDDHYDQIVGYEDRRANRRGRIINKGMGGFLTPPGHPEQNYCVETDLGRPSCDRCTASLTYIITGEADVDDDVKEKAALILKLWNENEKLPLANESVQRWILKVMGYYKGVWIKNGKAVTFTPDFDPVSSHAGVVHIRKFYPEFVPTSYHWENANWLIAEETK